MERLYSVLRSVNGILGSIDNVLWGWVMAFVLLAAGLVFTVSLRFPQIRHVKDIMSTLNVRSGKSSAEKGEKAISGFAAFCAAAGGQVGTGSLVGVASALAAGGPGALFWMWVTGLVGMATSFVEAVLGQIYHVRNEDGTYYGGAHYYMSRGLNSNLSARLYAIVTILSVGLPLAMIQNNSVASAAANAAGVPSYAAGLVATAFAAFTVLGGAKKITDTASRIVPFMACTYILMTLYIVATHITRLPEVVKMIFTYAFTPMAAAGGAVGYTVRQAFRQGIARGLFSNDAGNGGHASMHATAQVSHPAKQGFAAMLGTFLTTIVICSCTGFALLLTDAFKTDAVGINLIQEAFASTTGVLGRWIVCLAMALFGFTALVDDIYYGEVSVRYLCKRRAEGAVRTYKVISLVLVFLATIMPLDALWNMVDFSTALLIAVNVPAILRLLKVVRYALTDYEKARAEGIKEPVWEGKHP